MKKLLFILFLVAPVLLNSQPSGAKMMPVTTASKEALTLYSQAMKYFDEVKLDKAITTFKRALDKDPDFFMANYQLAFYYLLNEDPVNFGKYASAATNGGSNLSSAENMLKEALVKLRQGTKDVTETGKKLVDMYPQDPNSYNNLVYFQSLAGDTASMVVTLKKAIEISSDPAPFYNQLGYAYLTLKQEDKAAEAFNKYIELDPENPNAYDSKGDYYMYVKKFDKAYDSYMKAYHIDSTFSHDKAEIARRMYERTEGKQLKSIII